MLDIDTRHRLLAVAARHDLLILEDNAYGFTAEPGVGCPTLRALDRTGRVIYIGTFAKVCAPGARVGFVVADQRVRGRQEPEVLLSNEIAAVKSMVTVNTSPVCQAIVGGALLRSGGSIAALAAPKSKLYRRNLALLLAELDRLEGLPTGVSWNRPSGGFFVRMRVPRPVDAALLAMSATDYGVLWTPMAPFHIGVNGRDELRLSCSYLDPADIVLGVARLGGFLRKIGEQQ